MARRWRRRTIIISIVVVALSAGLVFASLPYLQPPPTPHASIQTTYNHTVSPGTQPVPGFYGLKIPNVTIAEPFAVGVKVVNGTASFCVLSLSTYDNWVLGGQATQPNTFPSSSCLSPGQTQQMSDGTLNFGVTPGTWVVVALNYGSTELTVYFSPA